MRGPAGLAGSAEGSAAWGGLDWPAAGLHGSHLAVPQSGGGQAPVAWELGFAPALPNPRFQHTSRMQNTTPDDVPICEAYLAFLRANGDSGEYWRVLTGAPLGEWLARVPCGKGVESTGACTGICRCVWVEPREAGWLCRAAETLSSAGVCSKVGEAAHQIKPPHTLNHRGTTHSHSPACSAFPSPIAAEAGVTKQMLESLDRPIRRDPEWFPDKRDALIADFERYLGILKAVSTASVQYRVEGGLGGAVLQRRQQQRQHSWVPQRDAVPPSGCLAPPHPLPSLAVPLWRGPAGLGGGRLLLCARCRQGVPGLRAGPRQRP